MRDRDGVSELTIWLLRGQVQCTGGGGIYPQSVSLLKPMLILVVTGYDFLVELHSQVSSGCMFVC